MSDLKKILQEKYQKEVQPTFTDAAWNSFSEYQAAHLPDNNKKKRRFFWIFLFLLVGMTGSLSFAYLRSSNEEFVEEYRENDPLNAQDKPTTQMNPSSQKGTATETNPASQYGLTSQNRLSAQDDSDIVNKLASQKEQQKLGQKKETSNFSRDNATQNPPSPILESEATNRASHEKIIGNILNPEKSTDQGNKLNALEKLTKELPATALQENFPIADNQLRIPVDPLYKLATTLSSIKTMENLELSGPVIPVHRLLYDGKWMASVELGTGTMSHRSIRNVEMGIVQSRFQYKLDPHWRIEGMLAFQKIDYVSSVQNRSLGLRAVPLPRSTLSLSYVKSSTLYVETGVGIAYEFEPLDRFKLSFGPRFRYISEVSRNLTYEFADEENVIEQVHATLDDRNNHPYNVEIHTDLYYEISPEFEIGLSGNYLRPINQNEVILPSQWRILVGLRKNF